MAKTPSGQKTRKSTATPKTLPRKSKISPNSEKKKPASMLRVQFDDEDATSFINAACTPGRTTRSMAKFPSTDMPPPLSPAPSKRKTISTPRPSAKKSLNVSVTKENGDSNGAFVCPLPPKSKKMNVSAIQSLDIESSVSQPTGIDTRKSRGRKSEKKVEINVIGCTDSSEDDLPSVSMLNAKRSRKRSQSDNRRRKLSKGDKVEDSTDDDLPSVSMLGESMPGRFVRAPESLKEQDITVGSNEDDLPSVSLLGKDLMESNKKDGKIVRRSKVSINKNTDSKQEELPAQTRKSSAKDDKNLSVSSNKQTPDGKENKEKSVNSNNVNAEITDDEETGESEQVQAEMTDDEDREKPVEKASKNEIDISKISVEAAKSSENEDFLSAEDEAKELPKKFNGKSLIKKNRISVIDLTESPLVGNRSVLNKTFSPEKKSDEEAVEVKNNTFTEETENSSESPKIAVNDKTFSPLPSSTAKKSAVNHVLLPPPDFSPMPLRLSRKSIDKKNSPQLKRLQGTPLGKPNSRNNLISATKLSSAKKTKMVETAIDMMNDGKKNKKLEILSQSTMCAASPKLFKFGEESNQARPFRFSMVSESLKMNLTASNNKSAMKSKPAPNFGDMHNRLFKKAESIDETRSRHEHRAKLLLSGKKPTASQKKPKQPVIENAPKSKKELKIREKVEARRPLAHMNRVRMNDEQRQDRRRKLFEEAKGPKVSKKEKAVEIKGVRLNKRFELMMKNRLKGSGSSWK